MVEYSESYCLAILITNLRQRKRYPDPITVADCAKALYNMHGSFKQVSRMVGVHPSVIRKWINLSNAPENLRRSVKEGKIYPVAAFAILSAFSDDSKRTEFTEQVIGWGEPEIVRLIHYVKKNPALSVSECTNLLISEAMGKLVDNSNATMKNDLP